MSIVNEETHSVINHIKNLGLSFPSNEQASLEFHPQDDIFLSLLGTPNGKGVARMLAEYPQFFGCKTISKVTVYPNLELGLSLCWILEKAPCIETQAPMPNGPLSRKELRHQKNKALRKRP
jgi:hypothetical protein